MKKQDELRLLKYKKLLRLRFWYINLNILALISGGLLADFFNNFSIAIVIIAIFFYISMFYFLMKNTCPFCGQSFFFFWKEWIRS